MHFNFYTRLRENGWPSSTRRCTRAPRSALISTALPRAAPAAAGGALSSRGCPAQRAARASNPSYSPATSLEPLLLVSHPDSEHFLVTALKTLSLYSYGEFPPSPEAALPRFQPPPCPPALSRPRPPYLAPAARDADSQFVCEFSSRFLEVPPLDFQGIRGGSAGSESARHLDVVSLPNSHIFGNFGEGGWEGNTELRGRLAGSGLRAPRAARCIRTGPRRPAAARRGAPRRNSPAAPQQSPGSAEPPLTGDAEQQRRVQHQGAERAEQPPIFHRIDGAAAGAPQSIARRGARRRPDSQSRPAAPRPREATVTSAAGSRTQREEAAFLGIKKIPSRRSARRRAGSAALRRRGARSVQKRAGDAGLPSEPHPSDAARRHSRAEPRSAPARPRGAELCPRAAAPRPARASPPRPACPRPARPRAPWEGPPGGARSCVPAACAPPGWWLRACQAS